MARRATAVAALLLGIALVAVLWLRRGAAPEPRPLPTASEEGAAQERSADAPGPSSPPRALGAVLPVRVPAARPSADASSPGSFEGIVVSERTRRGVPGAELTFSSSGEAVTVVGNASGAFRFAPRTPGRWTLAVVTAPGHLPFAPEWGYSPVLLDARPGARVRGIVVSLEPAEEYRGVVVDRDHQPLAGVPVRILGAAAGETALVPLRERYVSGPDGTFTFVAPRDAVLEAAREGFAPARAVVDFAAWVSRTVELRFTRSLTREAAALPSITGRVELAGGQSGGGAVVSAAPRRFSSEEPPRDAVADADGRFTIADLESGRYRLRASYPGLAPATAEVEAGARDVVLRLERGGRIAGAVRTPGGEPVHPFTVVVRAAGRRWSEPLQTLSVVDPAGRFEVDGLPPGPARVVVAAPGRAPSAAIPVTVPEPGADAAWIDVVLSPGGTLTGIVRTRGTRAPLAEAEVQVEGQLDVGASALPVRAQALSGRDGTFSIGGLPDRALSLFVVARAHHGRVVSGIHVAEGQTAGPIEIELSPVGPGEEPTVELVGIGAVLTVADGALQVTRVAPGGGAAEVGLAAGDAIVRIDGKPAGDLDLEGAVQLIRGPEGSTVTLVVRRRAAPDGPASEQTIVVPRRLVRG